MIEVGTQYNSREAAERSLSLFADVVPSFLGPGGTSGGVAEASQAGTYTEINDNNPSGNTAAASYVPTDAAPGYDILGMALVVVGGIVIFLSLALAVGKRPRKNLSIFLNTSLPIF